MSTSTPPHPAEVFPALSAAFSPTSPPPTADEFATAIGLLETVRGWLTTIALEVEERIRARSGGQGDDKGKQPELSARDATEADKALDKIIAQEEKTENWITILKDAHTRSLSSRSAFPPPEGRPDWEDMRTGILNLLNNTQRTIAQLERLLPDPMPAPVRSGATKPAGKVKGGKMRDMFAADASDDSD